MSEPLVSFVVPIYNSENYLADCLDSILNQTYTSFEVICINDGSTDGSQRIIDRYSELEPRVRAVKQENRGVSAARNLGIELASGIYIAFVDSDDYIANDYLRNLLVGTSAHHDFVIESDLVSDPKTCTGTDEFIYWGLRTGELNSPCGRLFRRSRIRESRITFSERTSIGEDLLFNVEYVDKIDKVVVVPGRQYIIRTVSDSLSRSFQRHKYSQLTFVHHRLRTILGTRNNPSLIDVLNFRRIRMLTSVARSLYSSDSALSPSSRKAVIKKINSDNLSLRVNTGDPIMLLTGLAYRLLGLKVLTNITRVALILRKFAD